MTSEHDSVSVDATSLLASGEVWRYGQRYYLLINAEEQRKLTGMVGDRMFSKDHTRKNGRSPLIDHRQRCMGEFRTFIVAEKVGNATGAKGGRKANG